MAVNDFISLQLQKKRLQCVKVVFQNGHGHSKRQQKKKKQYEIYNIKKMVSSRDHVSNVRNSNKLLRIYN